MTTDPYLLRLDAIDARIAELVTNQAGGIYRQIALAAAGFFILAVVIVVGYFVYKILTDNRATRAVVTKHFELDDAGKKWLQEEIMTAVKQMRVSADQSTDAACTAQAAAAVAVHAATVLPTLPPASAGPNPAS